MRVAIFSATSLIAQRCASVWLKNQGAELVLIGRDLNRLNDISDDLMVRFPDAKIETLTTDIESSSELTKAFELVFQKPLDIALIAQGSLTDQLKVSSEPELLGDELDINVKSVGLCLEIAAHNFSNQGFGTVAVIGSVAGDRGRAYNYSYGATKAFVEKYVEGLQQRFSNTTIRFVLIKPGPTTTPMTVGHYGAFSTPEIVASVIVEGIRKQQRVVYAPKVWRLIMLVVRAIPFFVFKKFLF